MKGRLGRFVVLVGSIACFVIAAVLLRPVLRGVALVAVDVAIALALLVAAAVAVRRVFFSSRVKIHAPRVKESGAVKRAIPPEDRSAFAFPKADKETEIDAELADLKRRLGA